MKKPITQWTGSDVVELLKGVNKETWIKIGIGLAVLGVVFLILVWPAWFKRPKLKMDIVAVEAKIIRVETLRRNQKTWEQSKRDYIDFSNSVKERLYLPGEASLLLGEISKLAMASDVKIIASRPKDFGEEFPEPFNAEYTAEAYDFTLEGGFHNLAEFVSRIESYPKILRVQLFRLRPQEENEEIHMVDMGIAAFSFKKKGASGAG